MRYFFLTILSFCFLFSSCQPKNTSLDDAVKSKQVSFPAGQDKKWQAIKFLENSKEDFVCDTLYSIYLSMDTTISGFGEYYDVIMNTLVHINSTKAARTIEKIYSTKHPKFLSQTTIINLSSLTHYELLFPGILNSLKCDLMNAHLILNLLQKGVKEGKITQSDMVSYLPALASFYNYSKEQRDNPEPKDGLLLNDYYWISNPELAKCLVAIKTDSTAKKILLELFNDSKKAQTSNEKELSWQAYKALDTVLQSDEYLSILCKDLSYRKEVYSFLKTNNQLHLLPGTVYNQKSLCEMFAVSSRNLRIHDTNSPGNVSFIGEKEINNEIYYFYWICWRKDCKSNSVVVVGPQPSDKTKFNDNPKLKGESISENAERNNLKNIIENYKVD